MNSPCRKNGDRQNFQAKTPHFFKIILSETIKERKLGIPKVFVRKYGEDLKDSVYLKVPSGAVWQVELKKCDGYVWLQKGWDEFVEYYNIEHGHFLVFRYEGNSQFHVIIFDPSGSEIEYPFNSTQAEEPNTDEEFQVPQMNKSENDDIAEMLDEVLPFQKKTRESPLPCLRPRKRKRTNSSSETKKSCKNVDSHSSLQKFREAKGCRKRMSSTQRWLQTEVPQRKQSLSPKVKVKALKRAFKSKHPYFVVAMGPSNIYRSYQLIIPSSFTNTYITEDHGNIILWVSEGRIWSLKYRSCNENHRRRRVRVSWKAFSEENALEVGDICVFELIKGSVISFKVSIFRAADDANCCLSPCNGCEAGIIENHQPDSTNNDESGMRCHLQSIGKEFQLPRDKSKSLARQESASWQITRRTTRPKIPSAPESVSGFKSEYPFFAAFMQPGYLQQGYLHVPNKFVNRNISTCTMTATATATLQVADKFWHVKFYRKEHSSKFSAGWPAFVRDHNFHVGDVCVFELIKREGFIFKVSIFRCTS